MPGPMLDAGDTKVRCDPDYLVGERDTSHWNTGGLFRSTERGEIALPWTAMHDPPQGTFDLDFHR